MVEESENVPTSTAAVKSPSPVLEKKEGSKKHGTTSTHPAIAEMVTIAIHELNEKKGSSAVAIKKYIVSTFKADMKKSAPYIRRYLSYALERGHLIQPKGHGGSFKLSENAKDKAQILANNNQGKIFLPKKHYPYTPREKKASSDVRQSNHPSYAEMVDAAIVALDGKRGSSVRSVKKYISDTYPVNKATFQRYITRHIISALESGHLVQTKGSGASGSIELHYRSNPAHVKNSIKKSLKEKKSIKPKTAAAKKSGTGKRGRPAKAGGVSKKVESSENKSTKPRGRPSKTSLETPVKKAGRPAKNPSQSATKESGTSKKDDLPKTQETSAKKRGRPSKTSKKN